MTKAEQRKAKHEETAELTKREKRLRQWLVAARKHCSENSWLRRTGRV